jgi:hypothetical protein
MHNSLAKPYGFARIIRGVHPHGSPEDESSN